MTIATVNPKPINVMFMTEWHRLFSRDTDIVDIR